VKTYLHRLIPSECKYLHNDIELRGCPPDEPENAHSHLMLVLLGSSEVIHLRDGQLLPGQWQSVMLYELDGPRSSKIAIKVYGK